MKGLHVELEQKLIVKDKDLAGKDVEIAKLKRCLRESQEALEAEKQKGESLEIDLMAEKDNYDEVQATMEPFINSLDWLQNYGVAHIGNSILNSTKLDRAVVALIVTSRAADHGTGYVECAAHVETALAQ
ncbi:hypothetical protein HanPSC8_Chr01g0018181 [Helianthus annuus]|nr:hypothetical protein HanPSC8_Chr01g0018181 [Helianthus annuus]